MKKLLHMNSLTQYFNARNYCGSCTNHTRSAMPMVKHIKRRSHSGRHRAATQRAFRAAPYANVR